MEIEGTGLGLFCTSSSTRPDRLLLAVTGPVAQRREQAPSKGRVVRSSRTGATATGRGRGVSTRWGSIMGTEAA